MLVSRADYGTVMAIDGTFIGKRELKNRRMR
jgi:hypothetical protein